MSGNNMVPVWKNSDEADEVLAPKSLLLFLRIARAVGAVPAGLRRAGAGWQLSVSPSLIKLQRIIVVITSFLVLSVVIIRSSSTATYCSHVVGMCFSNILRKTEMTIIVISFAIGTGPSKLRAVICMIRTTQKINSSFDYVTYKSKRKILSIDALFIVYATWQMLTAVEDLTHTISVHHREHKENVLAQFANYLSCAIFYQAEMGTLIRFMICAIVAELYCTLTLLNDKLEDLLVTPSIQLKENKLKLYLRELIPQKAKISDIFTKDARSREGDALRDICHINRCYDMICDMVVQIDNFSGPFLLLFLMLLCLQLLTAPQILIAGLGLSKAHIVIRQTNRILTLIADLLVLVEPCQRLQDQMDRTRSLLSRLVGQAQRRGCDPCKLDLFIFQAQMRDVALAPMGVVTIGRSLVGSIIGGVVTYLVIVFQFQK